MKNLPQRRFFLFTLQNISVNSLGVNSFFVHKKMFTTATRNSNNSFTFGVLVLKHHSRLLKLYKMKQLLLFSLLLVCMLSVNSQYSYVDNSVVNPGYFSFVDNYAEGIDLNAQPEQGNEKMSAAIFKSQEYCRAEVKDFEFEAPFKIISATIYFSGTNFRNTEKAVLTSNSLKPAKHLMERCAPGSIVIFDNVKVIGPDKIERVLPGPSLVLQ